MNPEQAQLLEMYKDVAAILTGHGIFFFIHYGTAIGAIRHNGFIPWDNDIDLVVKEGDLQEVNRILSAELDPAKYYYHIPSADTHPHVVYRSEDFENDLKNKVSPFIDIFVLEKYPKTFWRRHIVNFCVWCEVISIVLVDHVRPLIMHRLFSRIPRWFERRAKNLTPPDTDMTTVYSTTFKDDIFPEAYFRDVSMHAFEDTEVPMPVGIDVALASLFGDYMTPPPEDKRHGANGFPCSVLKDYRMSLQNKKVRTSRKNNAL